MTTNVRRGWFSAVPPNGFQNRPDRMESNNNTLGLDTPEPEIETSPEHRNLVAGDPACATWTRSPTDPGVSALREELRQHNGNPDLELVEPHEIDRAAELFNRDGLRASRYLGNGYHDVLNPNVGRLRASVHRPVVRCMGHRWTRRPKPVCDAH